MQKIPDTFCPAKWNEININLNYNYVYACCKSTPIRFVKSINEVLDKQKENLLNNVQDVSCEYCWKNENAGLPSARTLHLEKFDATTFSGYSNNTVLPKSIEVNLGNECNFQCTYCSPKFSSKWESDVKTKPYNIITDSSMYVLEQKELNNVQNTVKWLSEQHGAESLILIGGEPLLNKNLFKILDSTQFENIAIVTNLSCNTQTLDKIFARASRYKTVYLNISLDSTGSNAELARYGLLYKTIQQNIAYVLTHAPSNVRCKILSLMTSVTVRDIKDFAEYVSQLYAHDNRLVWELHVCHHPRMQSMESLPDILKPEVLQTLHTLTQKQYIVGASIVEKVVATSSFNTELYNELCAFLEEFCSRKNIDITTILKEKYAKTT